MNFGQLQDLIEAEAQYVTIAVHCEDEAAYIATLDRLGVERNDVTDPKSPYTLTVVDLEYGKVLIQYESGKPDTEDTDSDEEE